MINNRYTIIEKIGEGRSEVFSCIDKFFPEESIAIKILQYTASDSEINSFNDEYEIIKRLSHPNIISVFDKGTILNLDEKYKAKYNISENDKFITMEKVDGVSFDECTELNNELKLINLIRQISLVLYYIHQSNYIYFDLKPENILISRSSNGIKIKIIDFGLTQYYPNLKSNFIKGTSEFLAPEILKKEKISFNADLYSLGIILYHLAYKKFPFSNKSELEIYRAHIEKDFEFPSSKFSNKIISLIKRLLVKNPSKRFTSSLEILDFLEQKMTFSEKLNLNIPLKFLEREIIIKKTINYIEGNSWGNIGVLLGSKGSGKTSFLEHISKIYDSSVIIRINNFISASNFWQQFFSRLLFSETIYRSIDDSLVKYITLHIDDNSEELLEELKTIVSKIASVSKFTLIIDDFDKLPVHNLELLLKLFPILLANQIKIVIAQSSASEIEIPSGIEKEIIELPPFSDEEIKELVQISYNDFIDKKDLKNLIISFADRTPTIITYFISELISVGIIDFIDGKLIVKYDDDKITKLLSSQDDVFKLLYENINPTELGLLQAISLFENDISVELISAILQSNSKNIHKIFTSLREKNILKPNTQNRNPSFLNTGFKQYIYKGISDVPKKHLNAGKIILEKFPEIDSLSKIRQFELANDFNEAKKIIDCTLALANSLNFPQIKIKLLLKILSYNLTNEEVIQASFSLCEVYSNVGKYLEAFNIIQNIDDTLLSKYDLLQKNRLHGILLIKTGELKNGIKLLINVVDNLPKQKDEINIELAGAFIELNDYSKADLICNEILKISDNQSEIKGRAQNLLGISNLYSKSDLTITLKYFKDAHKTYTSINNFNRMAGSEVNLGNIQNILGKYSKAEKHWNKALQLNRSIGNVEQEANVLLSTGIFYYEHANYEKAIDIYHKAGDIFKGLGNKFRLGLVNANLSETYLEICEYQKAFNSIKIASEIFMELNNNDELLKVLIHECRLFIFVENKSALRQTLEKIEKIMPLKSERGKILYKIFLKFEEKMNSGSIDLDEIHNLKEQLFINNDRLLAIELQFLLANEYFNSGQFKISISILQSKMITDICEFNQKYEAHRLYLLSKIPPKYQSDITLTKNFLLHKSFVILQNISISELTIHVLIDLANFYLERGNVSKAREYALLAETIINYIRFETTSKIILKPLFEIKLKKIINNLENIRNL